MKFNREILKGHLKTIVLAVLDESSCHAYALQKRIKDKSLGVFDLTEGTVYPTLHKMEKEGLIESSWLERAQGPNIRMYSLTQKGKKTLEEAIREWKYFYRAFEMILQKNTIQSEESHL